jgi:hypothetical protein
VNWSKRRWFHTIRLVAWTVQIPLAIATDLKSSVAYLVFLSLAALIESSYTDLDQTLKDEQ